MKKNEFNILHWNLLQGRWIKGSTFLFKFQQAAKHWLIPPPSFYQVDGFWKSFGRVVLSQKTQGSLLFKLFPAEIFLWKQEFLISAPFLSFSDVLKIIFSDIVTVPSEDWTKSGVYTKIWLVLDQRMWRYFFLLHGLSFWRGLPSSLPATRSHAWFKSKTDFLRWQDDCSRTHTVRITFTVCLPVLLSFCGQMSENQALLGQSHKLKAHFCPVIDWSLIPDSKNNPDVVRNRNTEIEIMWPSSIEVSNAAEKKRALYLRGVPPSETSLSLRNIWCSSGNKLAIVRKSSKCWRLFILHS